MGFGPVNVPGSGGSPEELEAVRKLAQGADEKANAAKSTAETAEATATAAMQAASEAGSSAGTANQDAAAALEAAQRAESAATAASKSAATASEAANAAKQTASDAATAAENAQNDATAALQAVKKLTNTINAVPSQNGTLIYNGDEQQPSWNSYDPEQLTLGGVKEATNAGTYQASFTPKGEFTWADGSQDPKEVDWTIRRKTVALPTQNGTLTYDGTPQTPVWDGYSAGELDIGGSTSETAAGTYQASFTPQDNYQWSDNTYGPRNANWTIQKAAGSLSLQPAKLSLSVSKMQDEITVNRAGDGKITIQVDNSAAVDATLVGTKITVKANAKGSAKITVSVAAGTNHLAPENAVAQVTVDLPSRTLSENTPAIIKAVGAAGTGASYWSVGDKIAIALSGSVGAVTFSESYYAFIIGFNHNESVEGKGIDFQFGKTVADSKDIAFCDSKYNTTGSDAAFRMNTENKNAGGWKDSYMRTTICPAFLNAMPSAWRSAIKECTKWSDNTGGGNDTSSYVTATQDKIFLLAEFEVHGKRTYANTAEQNHQKQYDYYANGNSRIKYKHGETGTACIWWARSVYATNATSFCSTNTSGDPSTGYAYYSIGFAPGFKMA